MSVNELKLHNDRNRNSDQGCACSGCCVADTTTTSAAGAETNKAAGKQIHVLYCGGRTMLWPWWILNYNNNNNINNKYDAREQSNRVSIIVPDTDI